MKTYQEWCRSKAKAVWERARPRTQAEKGALVRRALLSPWRARLGCRLPRKLKGLASGAYVPLQYLRRSAAISPASPTPLRNHFAPYMVENGKRGFDMICRSCRLLDRQTLADQPMRHAFEMNIT